MSKTKKKFICLLSDITPDSPYTFNLNIGEQIVVFQSEDRYFAVENRCPHAGAYLHEGSVDGQILTCHWHGWQFDLESGISLEDYWVRLKTYTLKIIADKIYLDLIKKYNSDAY
jgi:nitrite reductase/ring-hydroxylating ferredoxin subunit